MASRLRRTLSRSCLSPASVQLTLGHGLANMQTRAHNAGGEVEVTSEPGAGTTVLVWVPIHA